MRTLLKRLFALSALALVLGLSAVSAQAGKPLPLSFTDSQTTSIERNIEQQPGAVNPTWALAVRCNWSLDDFHIRGSGAGGNNNLPAGYSVTDHECWFAGTSAPFVGARLASKSPDLSVTLVVSNVVETLTYGAAPVWDTDRRLYEYDTCTQMHFYPFDQLQTIPDSGGGLAIPTDVALTVSNTGGKTTAGGQWGVVHGALRTFIGC